MQSKIETISTTALQAVQAALTDLVGSDIHVSLLSSQLQKKEMFLEQQQGRNIFIGLDLSGSYTGDGCLIISNACAIRLSGRMLMLPSADINQILAEGDFENETEFAFEDIIRTIIAAYLKPFQDPGGPISRVIYKNIQTVVDAPRESEIDYLKNEQVYYQVSADVSMDGLGIGVFSLLLPAYVLLYSSSFSNGVDRLAKGEDATAAANKSKAAGSPHPGPSLLIVGLLQKDSRFDVLVPQIAVRTARELSRLMDIPVSIESADQGFIDGERVFRSLQNNAYLNARFLLAGPVAGEIMIVAAPEHAVWLGALLVDGVHGAVLARLQDASLDADRQEGFAEICTIFLDFVIDVIGSESKSDLEVTPQGVVAFVPGDEESFSRERDADRDYYTAIMKLSAGALGHADLHLLIPAEALELLPMEEAEDDGSAETTAQTVHFGADEINGSSVGNRGYQERFFEANILVIDGDTGYGKVIQTQLGDDRVASDVIAATAEISRTMLETYSAVILVVEGLNETALGLAIKIQAASSIPLIVAASRWTQSEVLKAIRYGVSDILMTPARPGEVVEKLKNLAGGAVR